MDFSNLVTRDIDEEFCYIRYDEFELLMMKANNYINATKLCKLGNKRFRDWLRLDGSKELIQTVEEINGLWKINAQRRSARGIIIEVNGSNQYSKYDVAGSYVHQDLLPHITSWISSSFAVKVSKIVNCYMSEQYEFKLKEKETTNKELLELLYAFDKKYDRDTAELKERYREQRKETKELKSSLTELKELNKELEKKYDRDTAELKERYREQRKETKELKSSLTELKELNKELEKKYDRDTQELKCSITELKTELRKVEERLKDKVINPSSPNKLHRLVILQKKTDPNAFRTLRVQAERINQELNKIKNDYRVFFNAYEPNAVSCFNNLKERLLSQEYVKVNYNDFTLCDVNAYGVNELYNDLQNLDLVRKYA